MAGYGGIASSLKVLNTLNLPDKQGGGTQRRCSVRLIRTRRIMYRDARRLLALFRTIWSYQNDETGSLFPGLQCKSIDSFRQHLKS